MNLNIKNANILQILEIKEQDVGFYLYLRRQNI